MIKKYSDEMMQMYNSVPKSSKDSTVSEKETDKGGLIVDVTSFRGLYPIKNAIVKIFTGEMTNMNIVDSDTTDENGKTKEFVLTTPNVSLSLDSTNKLIPYSSYGISVTADGYVEHINLNVPIFAGVTSIQNVDLLPVSASNNNGKAEIIDEYRNYNL